MTVADGLHLRVTSARGERVAAILGLLAGVLYNSWALAFALDRRALHGTYLSVLEMPGRPHAHLFVACDVVTGALAVGAGLLLHRTPPVAAGLVMFGVGNVLEASLPLNPSCASSVAACGIAPGQVLAPHDLASLLSAAGLVCALAALRDRGPWMRAVIALGVVSGVFLAVSVVVARWVLISQAGFLLACGVALAAVPLGAADPRAAWGAGRSTDPSEALRG